MMDLKNSSAVGAVGEQMRDDIPLLQQNLALSPSSIPSEKSMRHAIAL